MHTTRRLSPPSQLCLLLAATTMAACAQKSFPLQAAGAGTIDAQGAYATTLGTFTPGTGSTSVSMDGSKALGAPDEQRVDLGTGGQLDVVFGAGGIIEAPGPDLRIYGTLSPDATASVYASTDGLDFTFIGTMTGSMPPASATGATSAAAPSPSATAPPAGSDVTVPDATTSVGELDLTVGLLTEATYLRVVQTGGSVKIDALQALHPAFPTQ